MAGHASRPPNAPAEAFQANIPARDTTVQTRVTAANKKPRNAAKIMKGTLVSLFAASMRGLKHDVASIVGKTI